MASDDEVFKSGHQKAAEDIVTMYQTLYVIYFALMRVRKKRIQQNKKDILLLKKICDRIDWYYNIVYVRSLQKRKNCKSKITEKKRNQKIIVSLTSYPKRIDTVWIAIKTLLAQTVKPDEVILWLADSQFDGLDDLPENLLRLQKEGLTIRFCDDLRSHKKYFYALQEYTSDLVILADDDMFYPLDTVEKLLEMHRKFPEDVCTITAEVMAPTPETAPSMWRNPYVGEKLEHSDQIQIFSGSGSLYPPGSISKLAFDKETIGQICPYADDLWLTYMAYYQGTKITTSKKWRAFPITIYGTAQDSLWYINAEGGQNDKQWGAIRKKYPMELRNN